MTADPDREPPRETEQLALGEPRWSGGALARMRAPRPYPDFVFPQRQNPELAPPDWRPKFGDYLYLGLTNATAFSPTDVMPFAPWAKIAMTSSL